MNAHESRLPVPTVMPAIMYIVKVSDRTYTLRTWAEVGQLCARAFVDDPAVEVTVRHVRGAGE